MEMEEESKMIKWKTNNTTLSEQFQGQIEKQQIPHCLNNSKI